MYCPNCGTANQAGAEKCVNCGQPLPKLSPTGEPIPAAVTENSSRPANWPSNQPPFRPGQPGSQYSYTPGPEYQQPYSGGYGAGQAYGQPPVGAAPPYYNYSIPADRVGVARTDAGFWPRLGAYIIDHIIVGILLLIVTGIPLFIWGVDFINKYQGQLLPTCDPNANGYSNVACNKVLTDILLNQGGLGSFFGLFSLALALGVLVYTLYYTLQTARGTTIGKRVFGLRVVNEEGNPPGFGRALLRTTIGYTISGLFLGLGFLWIAFDPQHQGWHDKIARTYVVRE